MKEKTCQVSETWHVFSFSIFIFPIGLLIPDANAARPHFRLLTLRTLNPATDAFYRVPGFVTQPVIEGATHHLEF